jgi:hypothetical protein
MTEVGIAEYFGMAEALNNCYIVCNSVFLKKTNEGPIGRYRNKDSQ